VDSPTPIIIALPLPFWNDWNVPLPILPNTSRYRPERSVERSRVEYRQACSGELYGHIVAGHPDTGVGYVVPSYCHGLDKLWEWYVVYIGVNM
jgi:hypothetical protein